MAIAVAGKRLERAAAVDVPAQVLPPLLTVTLAAATAEVVLLRLISRIGVHIPAMGWARGGYTVAVTVGGYAFPLAAVFAAATLAVLAVAILRRAPLAALPALVLLGFQGWLLGRAADASAVALHELLLGGSLLAILVAAPRRADRRRPLLLLTLIVTAEALGQAQAASVNMAAGGGTALPVSLTAAGEIILLTALLAAPWLLAPPAWPRAALLAGAAFAVLAGGALVANGATTRILALWTFGLAMPAPALLYVLAGAGLTATAVAHLRAGRAMTAAGLTLIVLGGYVPPNSYQADLLLSGVLLLALVVAPMENAVRAAVITGERQPESSGALS